MSSNDLFQGHGQVNNSLYSMAYPNDHMILDGIDVNGEILLCPPVSQYSLRDGQAYYDEIMSPMGSEDSPVSTSSNDSEYNLNLINRTETHHQPEGFAADGPETVSYHAEWNVYTTSGGVVLDPNTIMRHSYPDSFQYNLYNVETFDDLNSSVSFWNNSRSQNKLKDCGNNRSNSTPDFSPGDLLPRMDRTPCILIDFKQTFDLECLREFGSAGGLGEALFQCILEKCGPSCQRVYPTVEEIDQHLKTSIKDRPFVCGSCKTRFKAKTDCERHVVNRNNPKAHSCKALYCDRKFGRKDGMIQHYRAIHENQDNERPKYRKKMTKNKKSPLA